MPEPRAPVQRRSNDGRLDDVIRMIEKLDLKLDKNWEKLEGRVDSLESSRDRMEGSWAFVRSTQVILGIIVALLTLALMTGRLHP